VADLIFISSTPLILFLYSEGQNSVPEFNEKDTKKKAVDSSPANYDIGIYF
jgi:hypothetical protein